MKKLLFILLTTPCFAEEPYTPYAEAYNLHLQTGRPLVVQVGATWCPPCVKLKSQVQSEIRTKKAILTYLDKDEYPKAYAKINPKTITPFL